jgi:hypothetical protein
MIKVCTLKDRTHRVGECYSFSNKQLERALDFARIGSLHGRVRRVTVCGRLARIYSNGIKVAGTHPMAALRKRAKSCR